MRWTKVYEIKLQVFAGFGIGLDARASSVCAGWANQKSCADSFAFTGDFRFVFHFDIFAPPIRVGASCSSYISSRGLHHRRQD